MMFADLIDLEDFADRLRELGLALPVGADETLVARELEGWLEEASQSGLAAIEQMIAELEQQSRGLMLPSVEAMVHHARERIH
jgi:hypothetical protein